VKAVTREMEMNILRASSMNKVESYALARLHADCLTGAERLVTDREEDFLIVIQRRECCGVSRCGCCGACG
jgi:hypothetical protein